MEKHADIFTRPRLNHIVQKIYIPKFKAKAFSSYLYGGENADTHLDYRTKINKHEVFGNAERCREEVILGIESSFDNSAAALVNSYGEIKASKSIDMWD